MKPESIRRFIKRGLLAVLGLVLVDSFWFEKICVDGVRKVFLSSMYRKVLAPVFFP